MRVKGILLSKGRSQFCQLSKVFQESKKYKPSLVVNRNSKNSLPSKLKCSLAF